MRTPFFSSCSLGSSGRGSRLFRSSLHVSHCRQTFGLVFPHLHFIARATCVKRNPELVARPQRVAHSAGLQVHVLRNSCVFPNVAHVEAPVAAAQEAAVVHNMDKSEQATGNDSGECWQLRTRQHNAQNGAWRTMHVACRRLSPTAQPTTKDPHDYITK
jgi:hypothetical protein